MQLLSNHMESPDENRFEEDVYVNRIAELEKKVGEQQNELICLKATLAEALRRLNNLEVTQQASRVIPTPTPITPTRLETSSSPSSDYHKQSYNNTTSKLEEQRKNYISSFLPQRKAVHYRSTGSLHSDSQSSSSASPIPTPSPRATPLPTNARRTYSSSKLSTKSTSSLHKRWSSTGDFIHINNHTDVHSKTKDITYNDEEKSIKMFLRNKPIILHVPSNLTENYEITKVSKTPSKKLKLEWVYGYRGRDCRSNLYFLPTGEIVYFVAALAILYNPEEQIQRHYTEHTDDIKSLAIHPNKMTIATGQCTGHNNLERRAHIRVWNSISLHTQYVIGMNDFDSAVCCLSFGKVDGSLLLAVDDAPDHTISLWDWQKGENGYKITETKCSVDTVVSAEFHPIDNNCIVTCGKTHIAFWSIQINGNLFKRNGIFEIRDRPRYVTCVNFLQSGEVISGDSSGHLAIWGRGTNTLFKYIKNVHEGSIFSICVTKHGNIITGGGRDGRLVEFAPNLVLTGVVNQIEGHFGGVRIVSEGKGYQLLIGTTHNCILLGTLDIGFQPIVLGHANEIWALASHPTIPHFATAGYDRVLQLWDSMSHTILWSKDIEEQAQSICYYHDGSCIIVGCINGKWLVFDVQSRQLLARHTDGNDPIQVIRFSPDGSLLAIGSRDSLIYIYQVSDDGTKYTRVGRCVGHSSGIVHLDWAENSQMLRSNSSDFELLFWNSETCRQIVQIPLLRDIEWATHTCTVTFSTIGIWSEYISGIDINCCDRSHDSELIVTGDDYGKVKLYSFPASQPKSLCHTYSGHSSYVTDVKFLYDDSRVISTGGNDTAVVQWTVT